MTIDDFDRDEFPDLEVEHRVEERTHQWAREFVEYVIEEAGHTEPIEAVDDTALLVLFKQLDSDGHRIGPDEPGAEAVTSVFLHPVDRDDFLEDSRDVFVQRGRGSSGEGVRYRGAEVYADRHIDRGTVLVVHEDAVAPPPTFAATDRPWLVRDPSAVAVGVVDE